MNKPFMKMKNLTLCAFLGLVAVSGCATGAGAVAGDHAAVKGDIVDTAVAAGSFKTLTTALKAAGLVDDLKGPGPFTVFAPTDAAFAKLPPGTVDDLLKPEGPEAQDHPHLSRRRRQGHGRGRGQADLGQDRAGRRREHRSGGKAVKVGGATVEKADILCFQRRHPRDRRRPLAARVVRDRPSQPAWGRRFTP